MDAPHTAFDTRYGNGKKNWVYVVVAAGLAFVALSSQVQSAQSREVSPASTQRAEGLVGQTVPTRLDVDVDWSKVQMADNPAPLAVAAYDR